MPKISDIQVSVVLPCYEEAPNLHAVIPGLVGALETSCPSGWEVLVVSSLAARDGTPALADLLASGQTGLRVIRQPVDDPGYGRALAIGIEAARYPWLLLTDGDGQFDHADLTRLVAECSRAGVVVGRRSPRNDAWPRRLASKAYSLAVSRLLGITGVTDLDCAFKLVHIESIGAEPLRSRTGVINAEILLRAKNRGINVVEVPVRHLPRTAGTARFETGFGFLRHIPRPQEALAMSKELGALLARNRRMQARRKS